MSIKAEFIGMDPEVEVEVNRFHNGKVNFTTLKLGELEIEMDEKKYQELLEKMDYALFDETKADLEKRIEALEDENRRLRDRSTPGVAYYGMPA